MNSPTWVTLVIAAAVLAGTIFTGVQAHRTARSAASIASQASKFTVRSDRFADWQMHKRRIYGELLASVRDARAARDHATGMRMAHCFDQAFLVAGPEIRSQLIMLQGGALSVDDAFFFNPADGEWLRIIDNLRRDIDAQGQRGVRHLTGDDWPESEV